MEAADGVFDKKKITPPATLSQSKKQKKDNDTKTPKAEKVKTLD